MPNPITLPPFVDTETPKAKWYGYHLAILVNTLGMMAISFLVLEYELAKIAHPHVGFVVTPSRLDISLASIIILLGLANLSVLIFVFLRHLWLRKWMLATTILGWMLVAVIVLALQGNLWPVLIPSWSLLVHNKPL